MNAKLILLIGSVLGLSAFPPALAPPSVHDNAQILSAVTADVLAAATTVTNTVLFDDPPVACFTDCNCAGGAQTGQSCFLGNGVYGTCQPYQPPTTFVCPLGQCRCVPPGPDD